MLLAVLLSVAIYLIWSTAALSKPGAGILIAADLVFMIIVVERMIHTTYTVTASNKLIIHTGRISKDKVISIDEIARIDRLNKLRFAGKPLQTVLIIVTTDNKQYSITPKNEEDFIQCIAKRRSS
ncbi:MAG: PH domain-containing protein [Prevotellaceae bacterium]|nr:PH domain-containing protein [Candidatus Minthosoma caballi]